MKRDTRILLCWAIAAIIGINITTTGVLFKNALIIMMKMKTRPVKSEENGEETWHEIQEIEFELYDKQKALDSLAKYFDLYVERLEVHHTGAIGVVHTTIQEMRTLFDAMTPDERATHLSKLIDAMAIDTPNTHEEG